MMRLLSGNLKKNTLVIFLIFATFILNAQKIPTGKENHFSIVGHISNSSTKLIMLEYTDDNNNYIRKKSNIVNGQFSFEGYINEPTFAQLVGNVDSSRGINWDDPNNVNIIIEPKKMKIEVIENHFKKLKLIGSITQGQSDSLERSKADIYKQMAYLDSSLVNCNNQIHSALIRKDTSDAEGLVAKQKNILSEMKPYDDQLFQKEVQFIRQHPNSYLSAYILHHRYNQHKFEDDSVKIYFKNLSEVVQKSYDGKQLEHLLYKRVAPIGSDFLNFIGNNINGKDVSIDNLLDDSSTYTLIVFWASWCVPCRALNSTIKEVYQKYHSKKLNIIYVTLDDDRQKWLDAIKKDAISDFQHFYDDRKIDLFHAYGLTSIPADFLVKGKRIVAKYSGADQEHSDFRDIEIKLKQIFPSS